MLKLLLYGNPGAPTMEISQILSDWYSIPFFTIEIDPYEGDDYFADKIKETDLDTGDFSSGSASQHMVRDPKSLAIEKKFREKKINENYNCGFLSEEEINTINSLEQGIVSTQIGDLRLVEWANYVVYLNSPEDSVVKWFSQKRMCPVCQSVFHEVDRPERIKGHCDRCGNDIIIENESRPEYIRGQFKAFRNSMWRMKETASDAGKLKIINVDRYKNIDALTRQLDSYYGNLVEDNKSHIIETMREGL